jgi:CcmD family protein
VIRRVWMAFVFAAVIWPGLVIAAQGQPAPVEGFVPVRPEDMAKEQLPAAPLVFAAYAFVWLAVVTYVFVLWRKMARVERDLAEVHTRLQARQ